jgi:hypothetical protein
MYCHDTALEGFLRTIKVKRERRSTSAFYSVYEYLLVTFDGPPQRFSARQVLRFVLNYVALALRFLQVSTILLVQLLTKEKSIILTSHVLLYFELNV